MEIDVKNISESDQKILDAHEVKLKSIRNKVISTTGDKVSNESIYMILSLYGQRGDE